MKQLHIAFLLVNVIVFNTAYAQKDTINYEFGTNAIVSSGVHSPFWLQNNSFGDISHKANSVAFEVNVSKNMLYPKRIFDYSFVFTGHLHEHENKTEFELN
ncbi:MAG: hypothetical protein ACOYM7_06315, partial [Paludibacter sp.]